MKNNTLSVKKLMKKLILRTLRQLYAMFEIIILIRWVTPPTKVETLQFEFFFSFWNSSFVQFLQLCNVFTLSVVVLHWLYIYLSFYVLYIIHLLLILQVDFFAKWMWSDPFPLYAKLNPVYSQILHVRSIWNPFKIFTVSLSAEEFANETLKYSYLNFRLLPLKPFHIPR